MLSMDYLPHAPSAVFLPATAFFCPGRQFRGYRFTRTLLREDEPRFPLCPVRCGGPADLFVTMQNGKRIRINQQVKRFVSAPARFSPFSVTAALFIGQLIVKPPPQPVGKVDIVRPWCVTPQGIIYTILKRIRLNQPQRDIATGSGTAGTSAGIIREGSVNQPVTAKSIPLNRNTLLPSPSLRQRRQKR